MSDLVCNYCSCPPRVDQGCPAQTMACVQGCPPTPGPSPVATTDQGLLSVLNSALPNCPANQEYATFATPYAKAVAKGADCGDGYTKTNSTTGGAILIGNEQYDVCGLNNASAMPPMDLQTRIMACLQSRSPAPAPAPAAKSPAPAPAPSPAQVNPWWNPAGLPLWAISLIIVIVLLVIVGGVMTMSKPVNLK